MSKSWRKPSSIFKAGHPYYPPRVPGAHGGRLPRRFDNTKLHNAELRIFREIERERDGELSADQLIHARNAARFGALAEDLFYRAKKYGAAIDPIHYSTVYATLVNSMNREMEALSQW